MCSLGQEHPRGLHLCLSFNKHHQLVVSSKFKINLNQKEIKRSHSVIFLGLCFDKELTHRTYQQFLFAIGLVGCYAVSNSWIYE